MTLPWKSAHFALATLFVSLLVAVPAAHATDLPFNGTFTVDNQVRLFGFAILGTSQQVTITTSSYAGGGFDPVVSLFSGNGTLIDFNDDGPTGPDSRLDATLSPGSYTVALTQADNFAVGPNLRNGFLRDGQGNFTSEFVVGGTAQAPFVDQFGNKRNGTYAALVRTAGNAAASPEPASLALLGLALPLTAAVKMRRTRKGNNQ